MTLRTSPEREPSGDGRPTNLQETGPFSVSSLVVEATAVLSLAGRVDLAALPACRHAVDGLLHEGVQEITVDLQVAHFDDESIALLALMRRYAARHGARLVLADIPPHVGRVLDRTGVGWLYRTEGVETGRDAPNAVRGPRNGSLKRTTGTGDARRADRVDRVDRALRQRRLGR